MHRLELRVEARRAVDGLEEAAERHAHHLEQRVVLPALVPEHDAVGVDARRAQEVAADSHVEAVVGGAGRAAARDSGGVGSPAAGRLAAALLLVVVGLLDELSTGLSVHDGSLFKILQYRTESP